MDMDFPDTDDDYDSPWKDVLEHAFPDFMEFYFPQAHAQIDWTAGYEFKNTELRQVVVDAELGKRFADALVQGQYATPARLLASPCWPIIILAGSPTTSLMKCWVANTG